MVFLQAAGSLGVFFLLSWELLERGPVGLAETAPSSQHADLP